jgi:hypothetical protein
MLLTIQLLFHSQSCGRTDFLFFLFLSTDMAEAVYVSAIFYDSTLGFIKLIVLSLYQRILRGVPAQLVQNLV